MITEDYVSFDVAKLLKEKGFNELCRCVYSPEGVFHKSNRTNIYDYYDNALLDEVGNSDYFLAPTQALVMKWLREVHNIHINLDIHWLYFANSKGWMYVIERILENGVEYIDSKGDENDKTFYSTYEEAAEAAIKYCLENLV